MKGTLSENPAKGKSSRKNLFGREEKDEYLDDGNNT
jgi:hypothetical protein